MSRQCNGKGCCGAWDCDNCHQTNECDKHVICDECGAELYEEFYEVDGDELRLDCLKDHCKQTIGD